MRQKVRQLAHTVTPQRNGPTYEEWSKRNVGKPFAIGRGLFGTRTKHGMKMTTRQVPLMREILGDDALVGFVQAFNAADRINTFVHLRFLNAEFAKGRPKNSTVARRNGLTLIFLLCGTLYECADAITKINSAPVTRKLAGFEPWDSLMEMRKRWKKERLFWVCRNQLGHHLGWETEIKKGLKRFKHGKELTIYESEMGATMVDTTFPFAMDVIFAGLEIDDSKFAPFLNRVAVDCARLGQNLQEVFSKLMEDAGCKFVSKSVLDAEGIRR